MLQLGKKSCMPHAMKCFAQVVKAADCIQTGFYGTGEFLHNAYELERCVVPFAKARLVNGEVIVNMIRELLENNRFD